MKPPDWTNCNEEELWHYVAWHLEGDGIRSVLVGGAVPPIAFADRLREGPHGGIYSLGIPSEL